MGNPSEFNHGSGLQAAPQRGYVPTPLDRLLASRKTDPANPDANEDNILNGTQTVSHLDKDGIYVPGDMRAEATPLVTETDALPVTGQFKRIDPLKYNPGHDPEGMQDGSGAAWRASVPPNPKRLPSKLTED